MQAAARLGRRSSSSAAVPASHQSLARSAADRVASRARTFAAAIRFAASRATAPGTPRGTRARNSRNVMNTRAAPASNQPAGTSGISASR